MLCNLLHHQSAPNVQIESFTGNPLDYHYFMSVFQETVEYKIDDPCGRLVWLLKYTEGEAREKIKHCIQQPVDIGYDRAKLLLEQNCRILAAYRKEIKGWQIQSWQTLLTLSMMRICWPVTHVFLKKHWKCM